MAHEAFITADKQINFLDSAVGLVRKTCTVSATGITADAMGNKIVPAGTIVPSNDKDAAGILSESVDVTLGDHEGSAIVAGRIIEANLPVAPSAAAKSALQASGIVFVSVPAVERPALDTYTDDTEGSDDETVDGQTGGSITE